MRQYVVCDHAVGTDPGALTLAAEWFCGARHFCNIAADCRQSTYCPHIFATSALDENQVLVWDVRRKETPEAEAEGPPQSCDFFLRIDSAKLALPKPGGMVTSLLICSSEESVAPTDGKSEHFSLFIGLEGGLVVLVDSHDPERAMAVAVLPEDQPVLSLDMDVRRGVVAAGSAAGALYSMKFPESASHSIAETGAPVLTVPVVATMLPEPGKHIVAAYSYQ